MVELGGVKQAAAAACRFSVLTGVEHAAIAAVARLNVSRGARGRDKEIRGVGAAAWGGAGTHRREDKGRILGLDFNHTTTTNTSAKAVVAVGL